MNGVSIRTFTLIALLLQAADPPPAIAGGRTKAVQETAEYVLQRFGRKAVGEGAETLARKIEMYASRHGDEFFKAVKQVGPRTFHLVEEAGAHGNQAVQVMARHGEHGATWVVARPKGMQLFLKHGDEAASVLIKHKGIAEPVMEQLGQPALKALKAANAQGGRRLAMMLEGGELAKIGRNPELLEVIAKYGDRAMTFVWEHKGALATTAGLAAFLANPEAFINGARDIAQVVGENAVRPVLQAPAAVATEVAKGTNWTIIFLAAGIAALGCFAVRFTAFGTWLHAQVQAREQEAKKSGVPMGKFAEAVARMAGLLLKPR